jgi:hypothetical protein
MKMDRRKAMKIAAGAITAGSAGLLTLTTAFKSQNQVNLTPQNLEYKPAEGDWEYFHLDPGTTAELAYDRYSEGSCMYATIVSVVSQLAEKTGEPFASFPIHMFRYGHGGIGGYGSVCGALNGAAALIGLLITEKSVQDQMINDLFQWYEETSLPVFSPRNAAMDYTPPKSISNSILCHASNTNWCKESGLQVNSKERKERCRRLTGDVARKVSASLNEIFTGAYVTNTHRNDATNTCVACHGNEGKLKNTSVNMSCNSCHTESVAHKIFAEPHYKFMKE